MILLDNEFFTLRENKYKVEDKECTEYVLTQHKDIKDTVYELVRLYSIEASILDSSQLTKENS